MDIEPTYTEQPVMPSIGCSHPAIKDTAGELARAYRVIDALLQDFGEQFVRFSVPQVDLRAPASVKTIGNQYEVRRET